MATILFLSSNEYRPLGNPSPPTWTTLIITSNMKLTTIGLMKHANITHGNILYILTPHYCFLVTNNTSTTLEHHNMSLSLLKNSNNDLNMYQKLMINSHMNMTTIGI